MREKNFSETELMAMDKEQLIRMYTDLRVQTEQLQNQVDWYTEQLNNLKRHKYSSTSEAGEKLLLQLPLFDEAEFIQEEVKEPEKETTVKSYRRKHRKNGHAFTVEEIHHNLENTACPVCGTPMRELKPLIKEVIRRIPEQYILERHIIHQYVCPKCSKEEENTEIHRAAEYPKLLEGSLVSPSLLASIAEQKFNRSLPLYRQEKEFG